MMIWKIAVCSFLAFFFSTLPLGAEPKVNCEVIVISKHSLLVNFSWRVTVYSDKSWDGCDLKISFRDKAGKEIHLVREVIKLKVGNNEYSGNDICDAEAWQRTEKRVTTLDCIF
jgi:hypothetical protein